MKKSEGKKALEREAKMEFEKQFGKGKKKAPMIAIEIEVGKGKKKGKNC